MKYRMERGNGEAVYFIGVHDEGRLIGLSDSEMEESLFVLNKIALEIDAVILDIEKQHAGRGKVAKILIGKPPCLKRSTSLWELQDTSIMVKAPLLVL